MLSDRVGVEGEGKGVIAQPHAHEPSPSSARSGEREGGRGAHAPLAERKLRDRGFPWDVIVDRDDHDRWSIAELQGSQVGENWRIIADEEKVLPICRRGGILFATSVRRGVFNDSVELHPRLLVQGSICVHTRRDAALWEYFGISSNEQKFAYFCTMDYETSWMEYILVTSWTERLLWREAWKHHLREREGFKFLLIISSFSSNSFCNN